ncbi:DUF1488 domain-containing protein [Bauldia litoralis]|uniref:DUF1488 domain-containing protein n=1 Tax=Bauldia litoralis TaxID=665467 RepID=A0A1G6D577_9HYPH|nr:DUF1488 domain-containing protein [Bauldia litoralis]SDB40326.1 Protein of unknown function [Bauldia litoralis]
MSLSFPNTSRSYDSDRHRIRFWGHDNAMEVSFFLEENAIFALYPETRPMEAAILEAFDAARDKIIAVASRTYRPREHRSFYTLTADQFSGAR